jgi:hypothetical protein
MNGMGALWSISAIQHSFSETKTIMRDQTSEILIMYSHRPFSVSAFFSSLRPSRAAVCNFVSHANGEPREHSLSPSPSISAALAHLLTHHIPKQGVLRLTTAITADHGV